MATLSLIFLVKVRQKSIWTCFVASCLNPSISSTISLIYLGVVSTGIAWLLRFRILKNNGLVFQSQVAYLIPIFGIILSYIFLREIITPKVLIALLAVIIGIYFVKRSTNKTT